MGKREPKPTPTAVLKLRGSTLISKRRETAEVKGLYGTPECPDWLDAEAKAAWNQLVPMLVGMNVLTRVDANALARYCRLWSRWRKMEAFIEDKGEMYPLRGEDGGVKCFQQWPQVAIAHRLALQLVKLEQEFGLTPSARARIQLTPRQMEPARNDKSRFFDAG
jgi:P27 family predicted phage terminase small subunit